jgi:hypothetical protein
MKIQKDHIKKAAQLAREWQPLENGKEPHPGHAALESFLAGLSHQELIELMAVMSVGRGDPGSDNFQTLVNNINLTPDRIVAYLLEKTYLAEDLEKGLRKLDELH